MARNVRGPKYTIPREEAKRVKNLPEERIRTPASRKFSGRNTTEEFFDFNKTPIITDKTALMIKKQLTHSDYLHRIDALERIGELAEKGADLDRLVPAVESAAEDYSPYVRDAAEKTLIMINEKREEKKKIEPEEILRHYKGLHAHGIPITLFEGVTIPMLRSLAAKKIEEFARTGIGHKDDKTRKSIAMQIRQIAKAKNLFDSLESDIKNDIRRLLSHMLRDKEQEVRDTAKETVKLLRR